MTDTIREKRAARLYWEQRWRHLRRWIKEQRMTPAERDNYRRSEAITVGITDLYTAIRGKR